MRGVLDIGAEAGGEGAQVVGAQAGEADAELSYFGEVFGEGLANLAEAEKDDEGHLGRGHGREGGGLAEIVEREGKGVGGDEKTGDWRGKMGIGAGQWTVLTDGEGQWECEDWCVCVRPKGEVRGGGGFDGGTRLC